MPVAETSLTVNLVSLTVLFKSMSGIENWNSSKETFTGGGSIIEMYNLSLTMSASSVELYKKTSTQ